VVHQVNEGVREKENSDRLEWIQNHVQGDGITEVRGSNSHPTATDSPGLTCH